MAVSFGIVDYGVFVLLLLLSAGVGVFYTFRGKQDADEFLMGHHKMPIVPTMLSLLASFISGVSLIAAPAEIYMRGVSIWTYYALGGIAGLAITGFVFVPKVYQLKTTSIYEYFEIRFQSTWLRRLCSFLFMIWILVYIAVVIYAPAISLTSASGIPVWVFILSLGVICTFYTTVGGLKAVVWTDTLQAIFMYVGLIILIVKGCIDLGGPGTVFQAASDGGRMQPFLNFNPSPIQYVSTPLALIGGAIGHIAAYGMSQVSMQRYSSLPSVNDARFMVIMLIPMLFVVMTICHFIGFLMYAKYRNCDPITSEGLLGDQMVIRYVIETLGGYPGLPGIYLGALTSATLSTVSSGINSLAAVTWEDFLKHDLVTSEACKDRILRGLVFLYGAVAIILAFLCQPLGGILKLIVNITGSLAGPTVGVFVLGMFTKSSNGRGALVGILTSVALMAWVNAGNFLTTPYSKYRLLLNATCATGLFPSNRSDTMLYQATSAFGDTTSIFALYRTSTYFYPALGFGVSFAVGWLASQVLAKVNLVRPMHENPAAISTTKV